MRTILSLGCALLLVSGVGPATAADVAVTSEVEQACAFNTSDIVYVYPTPSLTPVNVGSIGFSCNFTTQALVTVSDPGGTFLISGPNMVRFSIKWDADATGGGPYYRSSLSPAVNWSESFYVNPGVPANTAVSHPVWVKLEQLPTVAGTYQSVVTYTFTL